MKFLQRPTEHQDEVVPDETRKTDGKSNKQRVPNEEISAYFTAENAMHGPTKLSKEQNEPNGLQGQDRDREQNQRDSRKPPSIELPDKPFLGFGSKGLHTGHDNDQHDESTEYYSWSESAPGHAKIVKAQVEAPPGEEASHEVLWEHSKDVKRSPMRRNAHDRGKRFAAGEEAESGQWIQSRRVRGPRVVEVYQPPATHQQQTIEDRTSMTRTTKQSLPRRPTRWKPDNGNDLQQTGHIERVRSDYRTSDILDLPNSQNDLSVRGSAGYLARFPVKTLLSDKENADPQSSLDRLLNAARKATTYEDRHLERSTQATREPRVQSETDPHTITTRDHYGSHRIPLNQLNSRKQTPSKRRQPGHIEQARQDRRGQAPRLDSRYTVPELYFESIINRDEGHEASQEHLGDNEMLDGGPEIHPLYWPDNHVFASAQQAEDLVFRASSVPRSGFLEAQAERIESEPHGRSFMRDSISRHTGPSYVSSIGREIVSERIEPPQDGAEDLFAGFWKPNKLY